jgi:hypothetical protein
VLTFTIEVVEGLAFSGLVGFQLRSRSMRATIFPVGDARSVGGDLTRVAAVARSQRGLDEALDLVGTRAAPRGEVRSKLLQRRRMWQQEVWWEALQKQQWDRQPSRAADTPAGLVRADHPFTTNPAAQRRRVSRDRDRPASGRTPSLPSAEVARRRTATKHGVRPTCWCTGSASTRLLP